MTVAATVASVGMVDLAARHRRLQQSVESAVLASMRSGCVIGGPVVQSFLAELAQLHGVGRAVGAGSGTGALRLLLQAAGVGPGDQVIVPAVTFFATAEAVLQVGALPVVVDVLPESGLLNPAAVQASMGPEVRAVMPVWLFGNKPPAPALDDDTLRLDDAAQAVGRQLAGRSAALSFYPTKVLGAAGDGGAVLTDDLALADRATRLASHGATLPHDHHAVVGHVGDNNRLDTIQAAALHAQLADLDRRIARRQAIARFYDGALGLPAVPHDADSPVSVYCLQVPHRDRLADRLRAAGIACSVYYPRPISEQPALNGRFRSTPCPAARAFCARALAVPCHAELTDADVERVVSAVRRAA